jgi:hypothetical protein
LNGAGASDVGPDLNLPQNPTEYLTPQGLHDLIRNPRAVRTWPALAMPSFPPDHLSDREIELIIAYLEHMAGRRLALALALVLRVQKRLATSTSLEGTDCEPIVCPRPQRRQGCEGLPGVTPIIDFMSFVIRSIAVMACRSSIEVTTCGDSAGFSVVTTQGWM